MRPSILVVVVLLACTQPRPAAEQAPASLDSLLRAVHAAIGQPTCSDVRPCRAVAFGAKPCGGPWRYLVYSTLTTDSGRLLDAVNAYNAAEAELNRREGRVSDCGLVAAPRLACSSGTCQPMRPE